MQRIILESAPEFVIFCVLASLAYAGIQYYKTRYPWNPGMNTALFALRSTVVFFLCFLLLGPIVKQIANFYEKPVFIILHDNSSSIAAAIDSSTLSRVSGEMVGLQEKLRDIGFESSVWNLKGDEGIAAKYDATSSDIHGALKRVANRFEGKNVAGVLLVSDGIFNSGLSPLYANYNFPIHTLGVGDTSVRSDIALKNIAYNKIAYQGNRFPIRAEVQLTNINTTTLQATLSRQGKTIDRQSRQVSPGQLVTFEFQPEADVQGIQKYDIQIETRPQEYNTRNNHASIFVEVVEGRKKILCIAAAPHPDIKALREIITRNANYEFLLHIPDVNELPPGERSPDKIDLVIFHQVPDLRGKTAQLYEAFMKSKSSVFLILGQQTNLRALALNTIPLQFETPPREYDEVTPVVNTATTQFAISPEATSVFASYPPVSVHFGKMNVHAGAHTLLYQRVGSVTTEKPLLVMSAEENRKVAVMLGEGMWRWRLNEFDRSESTQYFDEVFGKLVQYLSTTEDKRRFRSAPVRQEFSETEPVVFESQVYNEIYEPVYGNDIEIQLTGPEGSRFNYSYITSRGNTRYQIGGLMEGVYRYRASTMLDGKRETVSGEFIVVEHQAELQNLTADFGLLQRLSANTGGKFYTLSQLNELHEDMQRAEAVSVIHTEETYDSLINLKWVFWLLLILLTLEWGLRKYHGSY